MYCKVSFQLASLGLKNNDNIIIKVGEFLRKMGKMFFFFAVQIEKTEILNILHKEWEKAFFNV